MFPKISSPQAETLFPLSNNSSFPFPQPLLPSDLIFVFMNFVLFLGASHKWNRHTVLFVFSLFHFASCFQVSSMWKHVSELCSFYGCVILPCKCLPPHFVFSSVDEHANGFHLLGVWVSSTLTFGVQMSIWASVFNSFGYIFRIAIARLCNSS